MNVKPLALITGFGGINSAGRSSSHISYKNLIFDTLTLKDQLEVLQDLAVMEGIIEPIGRSWETTSGDSIDLKSYLIENQKSIRSETMVRKIDREIYDTDGIITDDIQASAGGQLPSGFDPSSLYAARQHPKALQMTVFGMGDALGQLGIDWDVIQSKIGPDEVAVFSGAAIGQMDKFGFSGLMQSRLKGSRASSKNLALGLVEMSADFINAYILGSVGRTGHCVGACATFLYNLQLGKEAIESGSARFVVVGGSEAPITPEIVDGFYAMSALSDDKRMLELQALQNESIENGPNQVKACRPFGNNIGMVLGESAQFTILMDDALAIELGANIYGSVPSVFSHADGYKSSISGPGIGNYITMAKCASSASKILGAASLKSRTFVHAHGTGTPANRTTESHILNEVAKTHGIKSWPVSAIKSYLGHSMAPASGDQLITSLGTWDKGVIPGIHSTDQIADDVYNSNLDILMEHKIEDPSYFEAAFLNAKGFGGNNASALILSPDKTKMILEEKFSHSKMKSYHAKLVATKKETEKHNRSCLKGRYNVTYKFNENVLQGETDVEIKKDSIRLKGFSQPIKLK
jgi:acetoacetyl-[acyl-carrier protein] synthase|tara:strand:+ start:7 stop:1743 length:1737 start_codon:yes stop_codon:yes gene_type:complete